MGRLAEMLTVVDATGEAHGPRRMLRPTLVLVAESLVLLLLLAGVGLAWELLR
jgi:hypothetical protein